MVKNFLIYILLIAFGPLTLVKGQEHKPVFFEKINNDQFRFFFDANYFIVDKSCEFKSIERVCGFNSKTNKFDGEIKDFDANGRAILTGKYVDGKKNGEFKAYHPNGVLKWESTFKDDKPDGSWKYYYPDSKPMLFITINGDDFFINQLWDRFGKQKITDGVGQFELTYPVTGFTDHGYTLYTREGKVKNGKPDGIWYINFLTEEKKQEKIHVASESYSDGVLTAKYTSRNFQNILIDLNSFSITPDSFFPRAEALNSKGCTFDEFTGFNEFIAQKILDPLKKNKFNENEDFETNFSYTVSVNKSGYPSRTKIVELKENISKQQKAMLEFAIEHINFYIPSIKDGKPINDKLTINVKMQTKGDNVYVLPVEIQRELGH